MAAILDNDMAISSQPPACRQLMSALAELAQVCAAWSWPVGGGEGDFGEGVRRGVTQGDAPDRCVSAFHVIAERTEQIPQLACDWLLNPSGWH
jgi:hypothetical protein